jgi:hypothetical protein
LNGEKQLGTPVHIGRDIMSNTFGIRTPKIVIAGSIFAVAGYSQDLNPTAWQSKLTGILTDSTR